MQIPDSGRTRLATIYLIRHGRADSTGEVYDRLTDSGKIQASRLAEYVLRMGIRPDQIFAGTMRRQQETAQALVDALKTTRLGHPEKIAGKIDPETVVTADLNEFAPTFWRGMAGMIASRDREFAQDLERYTAIRTRGGGRSLALFLRLTESVLTAWASGETPPDAESFKEFQGRVFRFLKTIESAKPRESIFVFSSGTPISLMLAHFLGWKEEKCFDWMRWVYNTSLSVIRQERDRYVPLTINSLPHLPDRTLHTLI
ncbi:MAG: histidine phosphatase family protein [Leptospirales bacterium]|nr:histidine phosphatase family protein [Leptospirales bacterium]